jgi:hypothetical protein
MEDLSSLFGELCKYCKVTQSKYTDYNREQGRKVRTHGLEAIRVSLTIPSDGRANNDRAISWQLVQVGFSKVDLGGR